MDIRHAVGVKAGVPAEKLAALDEVETSDLFTERERAALAFATEVVRDDRDVSNETYARLRARFSEPEIVELTFVVGYQVFASRFAKAFQLAPQGYSERALHGATASRGERARSAPPHGRSSVARTEMLGSRPGGFGC